MTISRSSTAPEIAQGVCRLAFSTIGGLFARRRARATAARLFLCFSMRETTNTMNDKNFPDKSGTAANGLLAAAAALGRGVLGEKWEDRHRG